MGIDSPQEVFMNRKRRKFSAELKAEAVRLVQESSKSLGEVARDLDLHETSLRN
ncbi:MAG: hypothetical protein CME06_15290 [Gemmatimonadetes bacterium]|nr:hypothetical protein [Gemmatimonadota bacterium]